MSCVNARGSKKKFTVDVMLMIKLSERCLSNLVMKR